MDCNEVRPLLDANADHELPAPEAQRVQQHIDSCDACRRESANLRAWSDALRTAPYHRAPQSMRDRIVAGLPEMDEPVAVQETPAAHAGLPVGNDRAEPRARATPRARRGRFDRWLDAWRAPQGGFSRPGTGVSLSGGSGGVLARGWLAALVVALGAVAAAVALNLPRPADFAPFADELVESHVRAQMSERGIDVISTDRHTVKPWFNGRLDYTPPVEDLAASGFPLQGGRLDYLAHQRVAVLVYGYQKHVIDVYVFPEAGAGDTGGNKGGAAPPMLVREGYSIAHWNAEGMNWWAISDAAPDALRGLQAALKARLQSGSARTEAGS
jgi:anti-sigma factor RsiW